MPQLTFREKTYDIEGHYIPYVSVTLYNPEEGGYYKIVRIYLDGKDVTEKMEQHIEEMEQLIYDMI